jgi:hypothetical protein
VAPSATVSVAVGGETSMLSKVGSPASPLPPVPVLLPQPPESAATASVSVKTSLMRHRIAAPYKPCTEIANSFRARGISHIGSTGERRRRAE